jgi:uncharacterized protein (TIGR03435 family)
VTASLFGQIAFEVASIKPAPPQEMGRVSISRHTDKGRLNYSNVSFIDLITDAYRVQPRQVAGPDWLDSVRFDITAKLPAGADEDHIPEMLQSLLAERFALKLREESKEMSIYALVVANNGPKMKKADEAGSINSNGNNGRMQIAGKGTMAKLADRLSGRLDRPVVDKTGLEGNWEFALHWATEAVEAANADDAPSIFTAVQEQLGLKLMPMKGPVRQLIVEHIDRLPTEN